MDTSIHWTVHDRYGNAIYLTEERWTHITDNLNHPEMRDYEAELQATIRTGQRKQDILNPHKYRYSQAFERLAEDNTHIIAIVLLHFSPGAHGEPLPNNYIVTAYQKEIG